MENNMIDFFLISLKDTGSEKIYLVCKCKLEKNKRLIFLWGTN